MDPERGQEIGGRPFDAERPFHALPSPTAPWARRRWARRQWARPARWWALGCSGRPSWPPRAAAQSALAAPACHGQAPPLGASPVAPRKLRQGDADKVRNHQAQARVLGQLLAFSVQMRRGTLLPRQILVEDVLVEGLQLQVVVGQVLPLAFQHCQIRRQQVHNATQPGDLNQPALQAGQAELRLKVPVAKLLQLVQRVGLDEDRAHVEVALLRHDALLQKKPLLLLLSLALGRLLGLQPEVGTAATGSDDSVEATVHLRKLSLALLELLRVIERLPGHPAIVDPLVALLLELGQPFATVLQLLLRQLPADAATRCGATPCLDLGLQGADLGPLGGVLAGHGVGEKPSEFALSAKLAELA